MILHGGRVALGPLRTARADIRVRAGRIARLFHAETQGCAEIDISGHLILPGLINAHDHLSFNLFPLLGRPPYPNATAWAEDIYRPNESPIREHREIPREVRIAWGAVKNLISGVTTVAHHDPDPARMLRGLPVRIVKAGWAHSLAFSRDLKRRFGATPPDRAFIVHAGEATDGTGAAEIAGLDRMGALDGRTVLVHGVGFDARAWRLIKRRGASVITCPVSNLYTLRRTLKRSVFSAGIPIALGTDSALTAPGDLLDALRAARSIWKLSPARLYQMVTATSARILRLGKGYGEISEGGPADLIVVRDVDRTPAETLIDLRKIEMVVVGGRIRLVSRRFAHLATDGFESITVAGRGNFLLDAPLRKMYQEASTRVGTVRLCGRRVRIK